MPTLINAPTLQPMAPTPNGNTVSTDRPICGGNLNSDERSDEATCLEKREENCKNNSFINTFLIPSSTLTLSTLSIVFFYSLAHSHVIHPAKAPDCADCNHSNFCCFIYRDHQYFASGGVHPSFDGRVRGRKSSKRGDARHWKQMMQKKN